VLRKQKLSVLRVLFVFLIAFLSLSRTPMVALLIGIFALSWMILDRKWRIVLLVAVVIALPFFLSQVVRIDSIRPSNDGMGIRLVYWTAFFDHFSDLSIWGGGFLEAGRFLGQNAEFYRGEPHIHNTWMTTYVEFGIVGFLAFTAFVALFFQACFQQIRQVGLWIVLFLPILAIMMILYSGYDNDLIVYFILIWLVGTQQPIDFHKTKITAL
jgi:O-antigen ligase